MHSLCRTILRGFSGILHPMKIVYSVQDLIALVEKDARSRGVIAETENWVIREDFDSDDPYSAHGIELLLGTDADEAQARQKPNQ
jgi:hypothetical protein